METTDQSIAKIVIVYVFYILNSKTGLYKSFIRVPEVRIQIHNLIREAAKLRASASLSK